MRGSEACACTAVRKASRAISRHYETQLARAKVTATQFSILRQLERAGPTRLVRIAGELVMERTSLYRAIAPLAADGLVRLRSDPRDTRAKIAALTSKGRARIRRALPHWRRAQRSFVDALGSAAWTALAAELAHVVNELQLEEARS